LHIGAQKCNRRLVDVLLPFSDLSRKNAAGLTAQESTIDPSIKQAIEQENERRLKTTRDAPLQATTIARVAAKKAPSKKLNISLKK
jgi:hypothetical protein